MQSKILVIDDNLDVLSITKTTLERHGCTVRVAGSGREAIEKIKTECPDGVILDLKMPDMTGWEIFDYLRNEEATARVPVLVLTARAGLRDVQAGYAYGARYYLTKPCSRRQLLRAVGVLLERKELVDASGPDLDQTVPGEPR